MEDEIENLRHALKEMGATLHDAIEQAFHAHKVAERAFAAALGQPLDPLSDSHIEDSKNEILRLLRKATDRLQK